MRKISVVSLNTLAVELLRCICFTKTLLDEKESGVNTEDYRIAVKLFARIPGIGNPCSKCRQPFVSGDDIGGAIVTLELLMVPNELTLLAAVFCAGCENNGR